jgi:hypothetical protein
MTKRGRMRSRRGRRSRRSRSRNARRRGLQDLAQCFVRSLQCQAVGQPSMRTDDFLLLRKAWCHARFVRHAFVTCPPPPVAGGRRIVYSSPRSKGLHALFKAVPGVSLDELMATDTDLLVLSLGSDLDGSNVRVKHEISRRVEQHNARVKETRVGCYIALLDIVCFGRSDCSEGGPICLRVASPRFEPRCSLDSGFTRQFLHSPICLPK